MEAEKESYDVDTENAVVIQLKNGEKIKVPQESFLFRMLLKTTTKRRENGQGQETIDN